MRRAECAGHAHLRDSMDPHTDSMCVFMCVRTVWHGQMACTDHTLQSFHGAMQAGESQLNTSVNIRSPCCCARSSDSSSQAIQPYIEVLDVRSNKVRLRLRTRGAGKEGGATQGLSKATGKGHLLPLLQARRRQRLHAALLVQLDSTACLHAKPKKVRAHTPAGLSRPHICLAM